MKKNLAIFAVAMLTLGLCLPPVFAQASGTVKGVCKDQEGNPIVDGIVVFANQDNGQKYALKTNKKGEYFSLGVSSGNYNVTLYKNADDQAAGKELFHFNKFQVQLAENTLDFDLKKQAEEQAAGKGLSPEDLKKYQEQQAKAEKEKSTVKTLQAHLDTANTDIKAGDYDAAIASLNEANQMDPTRDVLWYKLGDAYRLSMSKQTDPAEKQKRMDSAVDAYQKAIQLRQDAIQSGKEKDTAKANQALAVYYGNMADAYNRARKVDDAVKYYEMAAKADPASAAQQYYNIGAVLTNAGRADEAIAAFDKCIAADPNKADAYYQKGVNLIAKETTDKDNKVVAPPGTAEAFQKYLELQPNGPYAEGAKQLLASIGASVETSYGTKKKPSKK
jgi:tetratricopeptide (TPR) repeat protein